MGSFLRENGRPRACEPFPRFGACLWGANVAGKKLGENGVRDTRGCGPAGFVQLRAPVGRGAFLEFPNPPPGTPAQKGRRERKHERARLHCFAGKTRDYECVTALRRFSRVCAWVTFRGATPRLPVGRGAFSAFPYSSPGTHLERTTRRAGKQEHARFIVSPAKSEASSAFSHFCAWVMLRRATPRLP